MTILTLFRYYLPSFTAGPIHSIANIVHRLGQEFEFKIITGYPQKEHEDLYRSTIPDRWVEVGNAEVYYCTSSRRSLRAMRRLIRSTPHDVLYLNSVFDPTYAVKPLILRKLRQLPPRPVVIAPRGMLTPKGMAAKKVKKSIYLFSAQTIGLFDNVMWHAASAREKQGVKRWLGDAASVVVAPNLSRACLASSPRRNKVEGQLKVCFLSRISPEKNLDVALRMLSQVHGAVSYDIYGPIHDRAYWSRCRHVIESLPTHISVRYRGVVNHDDVVSTLAQYDLFFLPTHGENFGHVILEALSAACPVLTSDQVPWPLEEAQAGWKISLSAKNQFVQVLRHCVQMGGEEHAQWSARALALARSTLQNEGAVEKTRILFKQAFRQHTPLR